MRASASASDGGDDRGVVLRLEQHAVGAAAGDVVERPHGVLDAAVLAQVEARADHGGPQGRQLRLERLPDGRLKRSGACMTRSMRNVRRPIRTWVRWRSRSVIAWCTSATVLGTDAGSLVEHAVDRGLAEAGLLGDLADPERMGHDASFPARGGSVV